MEKLAHYLVRTVKRYLWFFVILLFVLVLFNTYPELSKSAPVKLNTKSEHTEYYLEQGSHDTDNGYISYLKRSSNLIKNYLHLNDNICPKLHDWNKWEFDCKVECPKWNITSKAPSKRRFLYLRCDGDVGHWNTLSSTVTNISVIPFKQPCLHQIIKQRCADDERFVPKIVHYVWLGEKPRLFEFQNFLSVFSAHKFIKPCMIFFHGETLPHGIYWDFLLKYVPNIVHVYRRAPETIFSTKLSFIEHKADISRLEAVVEYGGIYIDTDTIILRPLEPLRIYNFTLSRAFDYNLSNGLILSVPNATFANIWYKEYQTYNPKQWGTHSTILPFRLSKQYPGLIHVEQYTFVRPNAGQLDMLFKQNFNWIENYAIHLFIRFYRKFRYDFEAIRHLNTTMGSVARYVLYDSKELCVN